MDVFKADQDIRYNAAIDYGTSAGDFHAEGFRRALNMLLEHFLDDIDSAAMDRDFLILPILALFRHYLELRFKEVIVTGRRLLGQPGGWPWGHELPDLWTECRLICESVYGAGYNDKLDFVQKCVSEFHALDPRCQNFRYPLDSNGRPPFPHLVIGLKNLTSVVAQVGDFLDGVDMDLVARLQASSGN